MHSIILCGGSGTRLWPLSRQNFPKQFLNLYGDSSLLQYTFLRMRKIMPEENIFFITNEAIFYNVLNQIREKGQGFPEKNIIVEPKSQNTFPAITYSIRYVVENSNINPNTPIVITPADSYIKDEEKYLAFLKNASESVGEHIGTIGISPNKTETGYGYIRKGKRNNDFYHVFEFKEKPDVETAEGYLDSGEYVWNSGTYIFSPRVFENELKKHAVETYEIYRRGADHISNNFEKITATSIDYAIAEKSKNIVVFEGDFGWSDIGSFDSMAEVLEEEGYVNERHVPWNSKNVFVYSTSDKLIATIGLEDIIIVENNDSILISKKGCGAEVGKVLKSLRENGHKEVFHNIICHRPWGRYEVLLDTPTYKTKKIVVYPGARLSLQSHQHRSEHWVVVSGVAEAICDDKTTILNENESTYIPIGAKHRLSNPGMENLEIIEVQIGDYLEEDDIVRYDDEYKRRR